MVRDRLLIVDDEADMLEGLRRMLSYEFDTLEVITTSDAHEALRQVREVPIDLVLLDIRMPDIDGLELLKALKREDPHLTVIMMTAYGSIEIAVEAMKRGAYEFVTKPFDKGVLQRVLKMAFERNRLVRENLNLRKRVGDTKGFEGFVGRSLPLRRLYDRIQIAAGTDYTVLVRGESGTGKELVARALHCLSARGARSMVTINCPAIPEHLLESELFGHKRGAFTGADRDRKGLIEHADKSTLFLDEIGDIPVSVQTKLLRVLQERELRPLGASKPIRVDVRIIASTNRNIEEKIKEGTFREDLFYRLNVVPLKTPPLRAIQEDIPILVTHFTRLACSELGIPPKRFTTDALETLIRRPWPGNVRELQNLVRRLVAFSAESEVQFSDFTAFDGLDRAAVEHGDGFPASPPLIPYKDAKEDMVTRFTHRYVSNLLETTGGNVTRAAELSGLGRASLQKIMRRFEIRSDRYKGEGGKEW